MIEKNHSKFAYKFNIGSIYDNEWNNLTPQHCETFFPKMIYFYFLHY